MHKTKGIYPFSIKNGFLNIFIVAFGIAISACSSGPKSYGIKGDGDQILNRDINGRSLSVVVRIYQLKDANEFSKLTFDVLADGRPESELLGPALLSKSDLVVLPGSNYANTEKLLDETKFVGIVAFFRRPDPHLWRQLVTAETVRDKGLAFRVQDCFITLNGIKPVLLPDQAINLQPECSTPSTTGTRQNARPATAGSKLPANAAQGNNTASQGQRRPTSNGENRDINVTTTSPVGPVKIQVGKDGNANIGIGGDSLNTTGPFSFPR